MIAVQGQSFEEPLKSPQPVTKQEQSHVVKRLFSPVLGDTLTIKRDSKDLKNIGVSVYSQKHNMIIASPGNNTVHFFDASTLLPCEGRATLELASLVYQICFCSEIDSYLIACIENEVYFYNATSHDVQKRNKIDVPIYSAAYINSTYYALATTTRFIHILNLKDQDVLLFSLKKSQSHLQALKNERFLLSSSDDGALTLYRIDKLPKLPVFCSVQAHQTGRFVTNLESVVIQNKEYVVTGGLDGKIHIFCLIKGKLRRLKAINVREIIHGFVFLEKWKILAITSGREANRVEFICLLSGKSKFTLDLQMSRAINLFWMEDKNAIGAASQIGQIIKMVQLKEL